MNLYGRPQELQSPEWSPVTVGETGLEGSMVRLGLGSSEFYPGRSGAPDCVYYMRTGFCGFGNRCIFNHPRDRAAVAAAVMATGDYPERPGEPVCHYYLETGFCKFSASCKFNHPKYKGGFSVQVPLNIYGYPLRPGVKECSYYMKTGQCRFSTTCKFNHPQPAGTSLPASAPQFYHSSSVPIPDQYGGGSTNFSVARPQLLQTSYVPGAYEPVLYPPGVVHMPGWNPYSASVDPVLSPGDQPEIRPTSVYPAGPSSSGEREYLFPERPGEPECKYYMKTGNCKFGSSCRYHHPQDWSVPRADCVLNTLGLPLRPGVQACKFYLLNGYCKFRSTCKFDHPIGTMRYSPSASSFVDLAMTSNPVGSLLATLPPSSPSQELRSELVSGSTADSYHKKMPS